MGKRSSTFTQARLSKMVYKGAKKQPLGQNKWKLLHQMIIVIKVNYMLGKG